MTDWKEQSIPPRPRSKPVKLAPRPTLRKGWLGMADWVANTLEFLGRLARFFESRRGK